MTNDRQWTVILEKQCFQCFSSGSNRIFFLEKNSSQVDQTEFLHETTNFLAYFQESEE